MCCFTWVCVIVMCGCRKRSELEMKGTCVSFAKALKTHEWFQKHRNVDFCVWSASCGNMAKLAALTGFDGVIGVSGFGYAAFLWILWFPTTTEEVGVCVSDGVCVQCSTGKGSRLSLPLSLSLGGAPDKLRVKKGMDDGTVQLWFSRRKDDVTHIVTIPVWDKCDVRVDPSKAAIKPSNSEIP